MRWWAVLVFTVCFARGGAASAEEPMGPIAYTFTLGKSTLKVLPLTLPGLEAREETDDQLRAWWGGSVSGSDVFVEVRVYSHADYELLEPDAVTDFARYAMRQPERGGDPAFTFTKVETVMGEYGFVPAASLAFGPLPSAANVQGEVMVLGGVLDTHSYSVRVYAKPALPASERASALAFLRENVRATGPVRDPKWSPADAKERWEKIAPTDKIRAGLKDVVRTK